MNTGITCALAALSGLGLAAEFPGWGRVIDPDGDCKIRAAKGALTIEVPGTVHDLYPQAGRMNAPRVMRQVEGDFSARVKVTGPPSPGTEPARGINWAFHSAGLLVWQDEKNYVRLERGESFIKGEKETRYYSPLFQHRLDGKYTEDGPSAKPTFKGGSIHLRLDREGETMTAYYSEDGKDWKQVRKLKTFKGKKASVGVSALNTSARALKVTFEGFTVTAAEK